MLILDHLYQNMSLKNSWRKFPKPLWLQILVVYNIVLKKLWSSEKILWLKCAETPFIFQQTGKFPSMWVWCLKENKFASFSLSFSLLCRVAQIFMVICFFSVCSYNHLSGPPCTTSFECLSCVLAYGCSTPVVPTPWPYCDCWQV